ncbi:MAG: 2-oxoacid:acceptor oxidoreductase subunit alpha [Pseudomonadota bacterium]
MKECNILIGGEAGQGLVTVGFSLAKSLVRSGYSIVVTQDYQSRIRGGHNTFVIRASVEKIHASNEKLDLLICLNRETFDLHIKDLNPDGLVVADKEHKISSKNLVEVPYKDLSHARFSNIASLGVVGSLIGLDVDVIKGVVENQFAKKDEKIIKENVDVLNKSFEWSQEQNLLNHKLDKINSHDKNLMMNGNEAIVLGALSAGIKFSSFYPMTPATSVSLGLVAASKKLGIIVEQAEDEIAAINMALGASYCGAPAIVATSGGGFALMVEGVSLSAMIETPIVIVVSQRPGPATGLPTRTEQADLEMVLHAGHGEFPRAIFAPGSVEECFHLTRKAVEVADKFQSPVFVLTDQFLADSYRAVAPFEDKDLNPLVTVEKHISNKKPYERFKISEDGISPRLFPGLSENLVVVDSDEHTPDGHLTEDLKVRVDMMHKRMKKMDGIKKEVVAPNYEGDTNPDLLFVAWGSTYGSVHEAVAELKGKGKKVAMLHFSQVWPLIPENFMKYLEAAKEVVSVEGNATGQFTKLIRREMGFEIKKKILRYDGLPITPEYILNKGL